VAEYLVLVPSVGPEIDLDVVESSDLPPERVGVKRRAVDGTMRSTERPPKFGKRVTLREYPMAEADAIRAACNETGTTFMRGHLVRSPVTPVEVTIDFDDVPHRPDPDYVDAEDAGAFVNLAFTIREA
jgi:hypothetical protein